MTTAHLADMIARDPNLASLAVVFDENLRADIVDGVSRVNRLRYKPGSSIIASLTSLSGTHERTGWIAIYNDPTKVKKTLARAKRAGFCARTVSGMPGVVVGETSADRQLTGALAAIRTLNPELLSNAVVLRHNPHRRVVFRTVLAGTTVALKVSAAVPGEEPSARRSVRRAAVETLTQGGVPVLCASGLNGVSGAETVPWWGNGDLSTIPSSHAASAAGQQLALLHLATDGQMQHASSRMSIQTEREHGAATVRAIATILPHAADRAERIFQRLGDTAAGSHSATLVHGDFSPDQVLVGDGGVRLIDFDRACIDLPERDLGSFLAAADLLGQPKLGFAMVHGYTAAGGSVDEQQLHRFTAQAFLQRSVEPFRSLDQNWVARVHWALDRAESEAALC